LAFATTEEQLATIFSEIGKLVKIRMVTDQETGKPRGFAFVEYEEPQAALSAIRNLNGYELNGRQIRVNFSNSSHLETLAEKLGMDMQGHTNKNHSSSTGSNNQQHQQTLIDDGGAKAVADSLKSLTKSEMYDVISQLKTIADKDPDEARRLLCSHPQLPEAVLYLMSKLEMVQKPLSAATVAMGGGTNVISQQKQQQPRAQPAPPIRADPRLAAMQNRPAAIPNSIPNDPRAAMRPPAADPRAAMRADPRMAAVPQQQPSSQQQQQQQPPPPPVVPPQQHPPQPVMHQPPMMIPPPQQQPPPPMATAPNAPKLDPNLKQQLMSLTEQQISALPPEKQQHILHLRQQIMAGLC